MKRLLLLIPIITLLSCSGSAPKEPATAKPAIDEAKTQEVFDRHFKAFKENDMQTLIADYADNALMVNADGVVIGTAGIEDHFERAFALFPKDSSTYEVIKTVVKNDVAFIVWKCKTPKVELAFATDTFIIQDGKIIRQTFAAP